LEEQEMDIELEILESASFLYFLLGMGIYYVWKLLLD
jgi:hypothetical protein